MARDLEADRLVFWQTPEEEGVGGAEIASWTINLNLDYETVRLRRRSCRRWARFWRKARGSTTLETSSGAGMCDARRDMAASASGGGRRNGSRRSAFRRDHRG